MMDSFARDTMNDTELRSRSYATNCLPCTHFMNGTVGRKVMNTMMASCQL